MLLTGCSKEEDGIQDPANDSQGVSVSFKTLLNDLSNRAMSRAHFNDIPDCSDAEPATAMIEYSYGGNDYTATVDVLHDESGYFTDYSEDLKIPVPDGGSVTVTLTGFVVYDAGDNELWVAPKNTEDADFAGYVDNPLPFDFEVRDGTKPYIDVDVLCYDHRMANEYGYVFFDINQKEIFNFCLFGNYCTPSGRHYVASYSIDVWNYENEQKTEQLYDDLTLSVTDSNEDGIYEADPLCVALPDDPNSDDDQYWFEITILDTDEYDADNVIVRQGVLTEMEAKLLFDEEDDGLLEYYHFQVGCDDDDTPPIFDNPEDETDTYYACLRELNDSGAAAIAYVSLTGNTLTTMIAAVNLDDGLHAQHLHGKTDDNFNSTCPDMDADTDDSGFIEIGEGAPFYGPPQLFLTKSGAGDGSSNDFPTGTMYTYSRTVILGTIGFPSVADMTPLDKKTVVIHGMYIGEDYIGSLPIACGQLELK